MDLTEKKVLVTGGNGYLGTKLIERLILEKVKVFSIDLQDYPINKNIIYYKANLRNKEELNRIIEEINPSIIYHLAASLDRTRDFSNVEGVFEINLFGTINLLQALKEINYEKFVFTSTSEVYGGGKIKSPFKEDDDFVPASPYSLSKYSAEMAIRSFSDLHQKKFIILRLFNFYGDGMPKSFFLSQMIDKLKNGENFDMTNGEQVREYLFVDDIVQIIIQSCNENFTDGIYNVCSGKGISLKKLAFKIKNILKSNSQINFGKLPYRKNEIWELVGDNSKILNLIDNKLLDPRTIYDKII